MSTKSTSKAADRKASDVFLTRSEPAAVPIWLASDARPLAARKAEIGADAIKWLETVRFTAAAKRQAVVPGEGGRMAGVALGLGNGSQGEPSGPSELLFGQLASSLPPAVYRISGDSVDARLAAIAWGLGAYRYRRYKQATATSTEGPARLEIPAGLDAAEIVNTVEGVWLGRDLINTPASDMGPAELEAAARDLAKRHGASVTVTSGDDLLEQNFPMIHAVGRASTRAPRLIDLQWRKKGSRKSARSIVLVGKGICFDTGGLDIKPSAGMLLMKKDMGGAATALALGHMIMGQGLDVALRILIPAAENSIAGNAFRPGDVLQSRGGRTVEIGNTDAEGRLVLADAISLADEEKPDTVFVFATLTGAARTALGPDLPALFCDDDDLASRLVKAGHAIGDPMWRLPFWPGYERHLDSDVADMNNVYDSPFAGAITAALFLKRFVANARRFVHVDMFGWRPQPRPLGPKGGEPHAARAVLETLKQELAV